jgi:HPt (histidine-containing phosphotransfer) domain-containing protein
MSHSRTQIPPIHSSLASDPLLAELVAEFVAEMPGRVARLRRQLDSQDWAALRRTAHQLKGAAGSYGFDPITPLAHRLEMVLAHGVEPKMIADAVHDLAAHCQRITADVPECDTPE